MRRTGSRIARACLALLGSSLLLAAVGCAGDAFDVRALESQGEAGRAALELIRAHGGMAAFHALDDLEYKVQVETYDAAGVLGDVEEEIHRFEAAPPSRYVLRHTGRQVFEMGLDGDVGWARIDGRTQPGEASAQRARSDLWIRSVLNRAPFSLADPDVSLSLAPDGAAIIGHWPAMGETGATMVFLADQGTGRLARIVFRDPRLPDDAPMQSALVEDLREEQGVWLVSRWGLSTTAAVMATPGLTRWRWAILEIRHGNGFTEQLYRAGNTQ